MNDIKKTRLALLCASILSLVICIIFAFIAATPGTNYSTEYQIHNALSTMTNIESVEDYLEANNISYTIENSTVTLHDYENISYVIGNDNSTGRIVPNHKHIMLSKLDTLDYEIVRVEREAINDGWNECISINENGYTYTKLNGEYFIQNNRLMTFMIVFSLFLGIAFAVIAELKNIAKLAYKVHRKYKATHVEGYQGKRVPNG